MQQELLDNDAPIPRAKWPIRAFNALVIFSLLYLLWQFFGYFRIRTSSTSNPLLPTYAADYLFLGNAIKGTILTLGILTAFIFRIFRLTIVAVAILAVGIIVAHFYPILQWL